jgi:O-antigen/teichoic acid export membrane protein
MIVIGFFQTIENFGISQAIIRRDTIDKQEASSLFFLNIFMAFASGLLIFFSSPFIANIFSLPDLIFYVKVVSLLVIIGGPAHLFRAFLEKNLLFKELSLIEIASNLILFITISALLFTGFGVLGVIYGYLAAGIFSAAAITILCIKNKFVRISFWFSFKKIIPFLTFGSYAFGRELTTFFTHRADEIIIGLFLSPEVLGFYYFGKNMLERMRQIITSTYGKILYPALARLHKDNARLSKAYAAISKYIALLTFPVFTGIAVTAHLFVPLIFGSQWNESILVFQVFSIALIFNFLSAGLAISVFYSVNKPGEPFFIDLFASILYITALYIFTRQGIVVVLAIILVHRVLKALVFQNYAVKNLTYNLKEWFNKSIKSSVLMTAAMIVIVLLVQEIIPAFLGLFVQLSVSIVAGSALYLLLVYFFERDAFLSLKGFIKVKNPI